MTIQWLEDREDLDWLGEVHLGLPTNGYEGAVITGNEDCPLTITLYRRNHIHSDFIKFAYILQRYVPVHVKGVHNEIVSR